MKRILTLLSIFLVFLVVSTSAIIYLLPSPPLLGDLTYSQAVYDEHQTLLRLTLSEDEQYRLLTPLPDISKQLIAATLLQEDQYFRYHPGVNPTSLYRAAWSTYFSKTRRIGASTITMQVARMRYQINSKSFSGKLWQILRALQLEAHYSKDEILEAYLNLAPYGNNIQGVGAASLIYFGKPVSQLSLPEALTLTVIPQNPTKRIPDRNMLVNARMKLYNRWLINHPNDSSMQALMKLPLQMHSVRNIPFRAPHLVNQVLASQTADRQIITTLDSKQQKIIETITQQYIARKSAYGINNAAVMLVDTRTMETKALLGSANFYNQKIEGQINGTRTKRSPGSTLKPFIYALAIDQGLIHPNTVLKDVPHSFGNYNPENFDNDFVGPIKAKDALTLSRNIPAIYLADQLKNPDLYEFLQQADISDLKFKSFYGLSLVLGGAEVSMQELVGLYATLANQGIWQPIIFTKNKQHMVSKRLLSPEASFLVYDMLTETARPNTATHREIPIAWKTGTSSGYRDAWTIGIIGPYVLAVWIGNFNNDGNPAFIGKTATAPLFFDIANALVTQPGRFPQIYTRPERLKLTKIEVCKASGMLPNHACPETELTWFIPSHSPIKVDNVHREIAIDPATGLRACRFDKDTQFATYEFWSSDLLQIFKRAGMQRRMPPSFDPTCTLNAKVGQGFAPQITSPQTQLHYIVRDSTLHTSLIPLTAVVDADVKKLYWFLNESYLGQSLRDQSFMWKAKQGHFVIRVVDDFGRADARDVDVQLE